MKAKFVNEALSDILIGKGESQSIRDYVINRGYNPDENFSIGVFKKDDPLNEIPNNIILNNNVKIEDLSNEDDIYSKNLVGTPENLYKIVKLKNYSISTFFSFLGI